jgi:hypothetical protein
LITADSLVEADLHGAMIAPGLAWNSPAQINRLKLKAAHQAGMLQSWEDIALENIALFLQIAEG